MLFKGFKEVESLVLDVVKKVFKHQSREAGPLAAEIYKVKSQDELIVCQFLPSQGTIEANQSFFDLFSLQPDTSVMDLRDGILNQVLLSDLQVLEESFHKVRDAKSDYIFRQMRLMRGDEFHRYHFFMTLMPDAEEGAKMVFLAWLDEVYASEKDDKTIAFDSPETNLSLDENNQFTTTSIYPFFWDVEKGVTYISVPSETGGNEAVQTFTIHEFVEKLHPEDIHKIRLNTRTLIGEPDYFTDPQIRTTELRIDFYDKGYRWYELRYKQNVKNAVGQVMYGVVIDVDERVRKFVELQTELEERKKQKNHRRELLFDFAYQLRTPLESIKQLSVDARACQTVDEVQDKLAGMQRYADSLLHSLGELEQVLGLERHESVDQYELISVWEYMAELQQICSMRVTKDVRVLFSSPYQQIKQRLCKHLITQTIESILSVSMEQIKQGQIHLGYKLGAQSLILTVTLESDQLLQVPKVINENSYEHNVKWAICKTLVSKMGGDLTEEALSPLEHQYSIELPISAQLNEELPIATMFKEELPVLESQPVLKILVVEDVAYNFMTLKTLLEDRFEVIHAEDGQRAVELFEQINPVFVFMDVKMPVMDGITATREIRKMSKTVPIVMLTAYAVRSLRRDVAEAGANEMLTKPTTPRKINAILRKYMKK